jgi:sirohydrochlorin ferrochelatase
VLAALGSEERWQQLQRLRRGVGSLQPWFQALALGQLAPELDLLAALVGRVDRSGAERLIQLCGARPEALLAALQQELPTATAAGREPWLEPLLHWLQLPSAPPPPALDWLTLLGLFRDARVAQLLRQAIGPAALTREPQLLVLLGHQRQTGDAPLLQQLALAPGPRAQRLAALEGLAVGVGAWPRRPLMVALRHLAADLDPELAAKAVDLLARLPGAQPQLQQRLQATPLVLVVHGRQGGLIPAELQELAAAVQQRRCAPVLLQALTAPAPEGDAAFWRTAQRAGGISLVPLLLLPGGHVRVDVPAIAASWRVAMANVGPLTLERSPFLGAWPGWQHVLAAALQRLAAGRPCCWLHHPLTGPLPQRYLTHLEAVLACPGLATPYTAQRSDLGPLAQDPGVLVPLTLAPNRLSESLAQGLCGPGVDVLPPLLQLPAVRQFLISALEALP